MQLASCREKVDLCKAKALKMFQEITVFYSWGEKAGQLRESKAEGCWGGRRALAMGLAGGMGTARTSGQHQQAGLDPDLETMRAFFVYREFTYSPRVSQVIF